MTNEELEKRVIDGVNRARSLWLLGMVAAIVITIFTFPLITLLWFVPIGFLSYAATLRAAAVVIASRLTEDELYQIHQANVRHDELNTMTAKQGEAEVTVTASSIDEAGPVVGTYMGKPIFEFIMVRVPDESGLSKFLYHGPARVVEGVPEIPAFDDMMFACANGILYSRAL